MQYEQTVDAHVKADIALCSALAEPSSLTGRAQGRATGNRLLMCSVSIAGKTVKML